MSVMLINSFKVTPTDTTAPIVTSADIDVTGIVLTLGFAESVISGADGFSTGFALNGTVATATYSSGDGTNTLVYNLNAVVHNGDTIALDYTQPGAGVKDISNNLLATFSGQSVTNGSTVSSGPTLVQQKTASVTDSAITVTFDNATVNRNAVVVCISYLNTQTVAAMDFGGDDVSQQVLSDGTGVATAIWIVPHPHNGSDLHITMSGSTDVVVNMSEWNGLNSAEAEAINSASAVLSASVSTDPVTPNSTNNLIIAVGAWTADDYSSGPINSFVRMTPVGSGATTFQESAYKIQTTAAAADTRWTLSAGINWASVMAAFGAP